MVGFVMSVSGYVAGAETQTETARSAIIALYSWIPAILCLLTLIVVSFYDLEKKMPQIREELNASRSRAAVQAGEQ